MKRLMLLTICAVLIFSAQFVMQCSTPLETTDDGPNPIPSRITDTLIEYDTIIITDTIYGPDTIIVVDTIIGSDTVFIIDTIQTGDTIIVYDTIIQADTIFVTDTVFTGDTLVITDTVFDTDTVIVTDTIFNGDTVIVTDTVFNTDTLIYYDTIFTGDTIIVIDTVVDTIPGDTVFIVDTVVIVEPDTTGLMGFCEVLSAKNKKFNMMLLNGSGNYRFELEATAGDRPCQTLIIEIDGQEYMWDPYAEPNLTIDQMIGTNIYFRIYPDKPSCFGHEVGVCVKMTKL